jgi:hypothetical protein
LNLSSDRILNELIGGIAQNVQKFAGIPYAKSHFVRLRPYDPANILIHGSQLIQTLNETSRLRYMQSKDHP